MQHDMRDERQVRQRFGKGRADLAGAGTAAGKKNHSAKAYAGASAAGAANLLSSARQRIAVAGSQNLSELEGETDPLKAEGARGRLSSQLAAARQDLSDLQAIGDAEVTRSGEVQALEATIENLAARADHLLARVLPPGWRDSSVSHDGWGSPVGGLLGAAALDEKEAGEVPHRSLMEQRFGRSFDQVRAYTGPSAARACGDADAHAFAHGNQIAFASENPAPEIVAHELAHVVQQQPGFDPGAGDESGLEAEADEVASRVVRGESVQEFAARAGSGPIAGSPHPVVAHKKRTSASIVSSAQPATSRPRAASANQDDWSDVVVPERVSFGNRVAHTVTTQLAHITTNGPDQIAVQSVDPANRIDRTADGSTFPSWQTSITSPYARAGGQGAELRVSFRPLLGWDYDDVMNVVLARAHAGKGPRQKVFPIRITGHGRQAGYQREEAKAQKAAANAENKAALMASLGRASGKPADQAEAQVKLDIAKGDIDIGLEAVFEKRYAGIDSVEREIDLGVREPPRNPSELDILSQVAWQAVSLATGGIAATLAKMAAGKLKTLIKGVMLDGVEAMIKDGLQAAGHSTLEAVRTKTSQAKPERPLANIFLEAQRSGLVDETTAIKQSMNREILPLMAYTGTKEGAEQVMSIVEETGRTLIQESGEALVVQRRATTAQWMSYMAKAQLGTTSQGAETGSALSQAVPYKDRQLSAVAGVLDIYIDVPQDGEGMRIVRARASGINRTMARDIEAINLRDLKLPVRLVCPGNLTITRNELGEVSFAGNQELLRRRALLDEAATTGDRDSLARDMADDRQAHAYALLGAHAYLDELDLRTLKDHGVIIRTDEDGA